MKEIFQDILEFKSWHGSRAQLLELLSSIEKKSPKERMLYTKKKPIKNLPVNGRRIQWFISQGIIPKPEGKTYIFEHIVYYWLAISRRKKGYTFPQLENLTSEVDSTAANQELQSLNKEPAHLSKKIILPKTKLNEKLSKNLTRLGREEGAPILSKVVKISITPWCQIFINNNHLNRLEKSDINVLAESFRQAILHKYPSK